MDALVIISHTFYEDSVCMNYLEAEFKKMKNIKVDFLDKMYKGAPNEQQIKQLQEDMKAAKSLIFCFPLWWYSAPASLKTFFDYVFTPGVIYDVVDDQMRGILCKDKKVQIIVTIGGVEGDYVKGGRYGTMDELMAPFVACFNSVEMKYTGCSCVFGCGMGARKITDAEKKGMDEALKKAIAKL